MENYPDNPAPANNDIHELIKKRWSPLAFSSEPIDQEKIQTLFEAMRWAPSSFNGQPWRVIYATKDMGEKFETLANLLNEGNDWAKEAYMLLVICSVKNFEYNDKPNKHYQYDTGAAIENLFLQAFSMGLIAHEMAGYNVEQSYSELKIPKEDVESMAMMAIGYPGDETRLTKDLQERQKNPRERKLIADIVFEGEWAGESKFD